MEPKVNFWFEPQVGIIIDGYRLIDVIRKTIFKVSKDKKYFAMKIAPEVQNELDFYLAIEDKIKPWCKTHSLEYLAIPTLIAHGKFGEYKYLILPLYDSNMLHSVVKPNNYLTKRTVRRIAVKLIETLHFMQSQGYVHTDIANRNIMLHKGKIYLTDFDRVIKFERDDPQGFNRMRKADLQTLRLCIRSWLKNDEPLNMLNVCIDYEVLKRTFLKNELWCQ
jgi:serine/threonine protein kinase